MNWRQIVRVGAPALLLAALLHVGFRQVGPMPPLGQFLHPTQGVWAVAAQEDIPSGEMVIPGTRDSVTVVFDDRAVPHIFAANLEDAYRTLGYVVARFRLFQLELQTRVVKGTLAEWMGERALAFDRRQRALGLAQSAEREFGGLDPASSSARAVTAYAEGINARIQELTPRDIPLEYRLLNATPSAWEPVNTFYLIKQMGYTLSYSERDLRFERLVERVGFDAAAALMPANNPIQEPVVPTGRLGPAFRPVTIPAPNPADRLGGSADVASPASAASPASNNWVVAPARTASGYALLAGDPHLDLSLPSVWFEAHLVVPGELDVYGVTFPGAPAVAIGFNRDVAWSFTTNVVDVVDSYLETVDDLESPTRYRLDGSWRLLQVRVEEFYGPDGDLMATDTLYATHRGPLMLEQNRALSLRWTVLEGQRAASTLAGVNRARSVTEWLALWETYLAPIQNGVVADRGGDIAISSAGAYPVRPKGGSGLIIRDGTTSENDWQGYLPVTQFPLARNPKQGYLASANQQPIDPAVDPTYLGADWPSPWRAIRINQLLRADSSVTPEAMQEFQIDPGSARADWFVPSFLEAVDQETAAGRASDQVRDAARLLAEWDRRYTKENQRAVLFEYALSELRERTWDELLAGDSSSGGWVVSPSDPVLASLLSDPNSVWWDDGRTEDVVETREAVMTASLEAAYQSVVERFGAPDSGGWRWDGIRFQNIYHLLRFPALSALRLPVQGGPGTLNPSSGGGTHGASWRMVVELGPEMRAWGVYPGGQSGNPASRWYTDRLDKWIAGELDPLPFPRTSQELPADRVTATLKVRGESP